MGNLASLTFMLGANIKGFQTNMRKAGVTMNKTAKDMKRIGGQVAMYGTAPIVALGAASLAAFDKQAQAEAKLSAQLRANGKDVDSTMATYKKFATELQNVTIVGDEVTLGLMQMAESMQSTDVMGATQGAIGLSKALGVDLTAALKMATLAQEGDYTMLNRYVPALRSATTEAEKSAIVQKLYADGLKIAKAEAENGLGPLKQLQNSMGDLMEMFGAIVADAIKPAVEWLKKAVEKFQGLSESGKKTIVVVAGIVAAIGPLLVIFGTMLTMLPMIGAAFTAMLGPVGLVVAAIAAIAAAFIYVYDNFEAFKERLSNWNWLKNAAIDTFIAIIKASSFFLNELTKLFGIDFVAPVTKLLEGLKSPVEGVKTEFKSFGTSVSNVAGDAMQALGMMGSEGKKSFNILSTSVSNATGNLKESTIAIVKMKKAVVDLTNSTPNEINLTPIKINPAPAMSGLTAFQNKFADAWESTKEQITQLIASTITSIGVSIGEALGNMLSGVEDSNFGQNTMEAIGNFLKQLGTALVSLAAMMFAFWVTSNLGPVGAVAAGVIGIAAIAAGQILINQAKAGPAKMAMGGIIPPGFSGDTYPALLSSGEMVLPSPIPLGAIGSGNRDPIDIRGVIDIPGDKLRIVLERDAIKQKRVRGY